MCVNHVICYVCQITLIDNKLTIFHRYLILSSKLGVINEYLMKYFEF